MINACQELCDLRRADEWTAALEVWWRQQPDLRTFSGQCLIHRAEIMQRHGDWQEAVEEAKHACERLAHAVDKHASGAAWYRLGEDLPGPGGDFAAAEDAYREATQWGHDAQPGLALLRLSSGQRDAAGRSIRRVAEDTTDPLRRAKVLPALVEIMLAVGDATAARTAAVEIDGIADAYDTPALRAAAGGSMGAVLLAEGDTRAAVAALRRAWDLWHAPWTTPYEAARLRVLVGLGCLSARRRGRRPAPARLRGQGLRGAGRRT